MDRWMQECNKKPEVMKWDIWRIKQKHNLEIYKYAGTQSIVAKLQKFKVNYTVPLSAITMLAEVQ